MNDTDSKEKKNVVERALKTAVEAFFGVIITEGALILSHLVQMDFADWRTWALPVLTAAVSTGISAGWNAWQNAKSGGPEA